MRKLKTFVKWFALFLLLTPLSSLAFADDTTASSSSTAQFALTIVKYKLSPAQLNQSTLPKQPTANAVTNAKDADGNSLTPLAGAQYKIETVIPTNDNANPFQVKPGTTAQTVTTDQNGEVTLSLPQGLYRVTELTSAGITTVAAPVVVQLPMTLENGQSIDHVYLYPKSSVTTPGTTNPPTTGSSVPKIIPHTAGNIPSIRPVYVILAVIVVVGALGLFLKPTKLYKK